MAIPVSLPIKGKYTMPTRTISHQVNKTKPFLLHKIVKVSKTLQVFNFLFKKTQLKFASLPY